MDNDAQSGMHGVVNMDTGMLTPSVKAKPFLLWWAMGLAMADWMLETILHTYLLGQGSFAENLLPHDANELWMRLTIIALIISFGYVASIFLSRQRQLTEHNARLNRLLRFLSEVNQNVQRCNHSMDMFESACKAAVEFGGFRFAWIGMLEADSGLRPVAHTAFSKPCQKAVAKAGIGPVVPCAMALQAISEGKPAHCMVLKDTSCEAAWRQPLIEHGCRSAAAFPILMQDKPFGTLTVYAGDTSFFHDDEINILEEVAGDISFALTAIEQTRMREQTAQTLQKRVDELERFQKATVQREFRIKELRDKNTELKQQIAATKDGKL